MSNELTASEVEREISTWLAPRMSDLAASWRSSRPFPHIVIDDFLPASLADRFHEVFPSWEHAGWDDTEYVHQRKKLTRTTGFDADLEAFFSATESPAFLDLMSGITGIPDLVADPSRLGGGCHQIVAGGFLDVHVDFNRHPELGLRRRLNLLVYLNPGWQDAWGGALELWDMSEKRIATAVPPVHNRAVIFETGEQSYHGHPDPLTSPEGVSRKSLAVYYYTVDDPQGATEHNTVYVQTSGLRGYRKSASAGLATARRHLRRHGLVGLVTRTAREVARRITRTPPPNG